MDRFERGHPVRCLMCLAGLVPRAGKWRSGGVVRITGWRPLNQSQRPWSSRKAHRKWCKLYNSGVSHFICVPPTYNIENLRFDVFHGRSGCVKVFVSYIRTLLENADIQIEDFSKFLLTLKHWDHYVVDQFVAGEYPNRLKGRHTKSFVKNIDRVVAKLKELLDEVDICEFCVWLNSFKMISKIIIKKLDYVSNINPPTYPDGLDIEVFSFKRYVCWSNIFIENTVGPYRKYDWFSLQTFYEEELWVKTVNNAYGLILYVILLFGFRYYRFFLFLAKLSIKSLILFLI